MKALLIKNFYELKYKSAAFLIMIALFSAIPQASAFSILWVSILPTSIVAYDERSKWNRLESMMPFTPFQSVFSKYLTGYIGMLIVTIIALVSRTVTNITGFAGREFSIIEPVIFALGGSILLSLNLPMIIKFGVEKGRWINIILIAVIVGGFSAFSNIMSGDDVSGITSAYSKMFVPVLLVSVAVNAISITISTAIQKKK